MKDPMSGKRFDGLDNPKDEVVSFNGPCSCGLPAEVRHTYLEHMQPKVSSSSPYRERKKPRRLFNPDED